MTLLTRTDEDHTIGAMTTYRFGTIAECPRVPERTGCERSGL